MALYLIIILFFYIFTAGGNMLYIYFGGLSFNLYMPLWYTALLILAAIAQCAICVSICRYVTPKKLYYPEHNIYKVKSFERNLLEHLGVRKFKDKIPELGKLFVGFNKTEVKDKNDPSYLYEFLVETCYAEIMHLSSCITSIVIIFIAPRALWLTMGLPICIGDLFLNILPIMVQRYNRPKLTRLYERALRMKKAE